MTSYSVEAAFAATDSHLARLAIDNALLRGNTSATSEQAAYPIDNALTKDTYQAWRSNAATPTVSCEFDSTETINYLAIARHNLGSEEITTQLDYRIESGSWTKIADITPDTDDPLLVPFKPTEADEIRLVFAGAGVPIIAVLAVGSAVIMPRPLRSTMQPVWLSRQTAVVPQMSDGGEVIGGAVVRRGVAVSPSWRNLPLAFYVSTLRTLARDLPGCPFFFAWQPDEAPDEVVYGMIDGDVNGNHIRNSTRYEFGFDMRGLA